MNKKFTFQSIFPIFSNEEKISWSFRRAYFDLSFSFKSPIYVDIMRVFKMETKLKKSRPNVQVMLSSLLKYAILFSFFLNSPTTFLEARIIDAKDAIISNTSNNESDIIYKICLGDTLKLNSIKREITCNCPPMPTAPCDNFPFFRFSEWDIDPTLLVLDNPSFVLVFPDETTIYTTSLGGYDCGIDGPSYPPGPTYSFEVIVDTEADCNINAPEEATNFIITGCIGDTLLLPRPNSGTCEGGLDPTGSGILFDIIDVSAHFFEIILIKSGLSAYSALMENDNNKVSCPQAVYNYELIAEDCGMGPIGGTANIFQTYPWLNELVDTNNCKGAQIDVFDLGPYAFLLLSTTDSKQLYFEDGTFYCQNSATNDCKSLYGLDTVSASWKCSDEDNGEGNGGNNMSDSLSLFHEFPWINELIDTNNCQNQLIEVYHVGIFSFIYIESGDDGQLYFENGTFYCQNSPNNDCRGLYGLEDLGDTYLCLSDNLAKKSAPFSNRNQQKTSSKKKIQVFPNPNNGQFFIRLSPQPKQSLSLFDIAGKLVHQIPESTTNHQSLIEINLSGLPKGLYFLKNQDALEPFVEKIVIK
jgi:hypothetical protein